MKSIFMLGNIFMKIVRRIQYSFANRNYDTKLKFLRNQGAHIGDQTRLICSINSFGSEPYLVKIGSNCLVSADVRFFTHDGGVKVLSDLGYFNGQRMDIIAPIIIGNNVYIGNGAYILPGVTIGDNVVIGAASVVTRDIPCNSVAVGVPSRVIKTIDEYHIGAVSRNRLYPTAKMTAKEKKEYFDNMRMFTD